MKIFFVGDNRARANYGCRATSIALSLLLQKHNQIVSGLTGRLTHQGVGPLFFVPWFPRVIYVFLGNIPGFHRIWNFVLRQIGGVRPLGRFDFVTKCPVTTLKNLKRCLPANPQLGEFIGGFDKSDSIVINGEGTFISSINIRRDALIYLMFIHWGIISEKKVFVLNAMLSLDPIQPEAPISLLWMEKFCETLSKIDGVFFRDFESLRLYKNYLPTAVNAQFVPDALFSWPLEKEENRCHRSTGQTYLKTIPFNEETDIMFQIQLEKKDYILVSGSSLAAWDQHKAKDRYSALLRAIIERFDDYDVLLLESCDGDHFLRSIALEYGLACVSVRSPIHSVVQLMSGASTFVSGRFHPSIMASLSGTPCVWLGSNSHKCFSLQEVLGCTEPIEFDALPDEAEIRNVIEHLEKILNASNEIRELVTERVSELRPLVYSAYEGIR